MPDPDLNTNRQRLAVFVFCFKMHALLLSKSRAAVLESAFFVHGNCCQLFQSTFPNFFSVKLGIYCCRQADVNNFCQFEEFQLFNVLRSTIDNHSDSTVAFTNYFVSGVNDEFNCLPRWAMTYFATMGNEQSATLGDES